MKFKLKYRKRKIFFLAVLLGLGIFTPLRFGNASKLADPVLDPTFLFLRLSEDLENVPAIDLVAVLILKLFKKISGLTSFIR